MVCALWAQQTQIRIQYILVWFAKCFDKVYLIRLFVNFQIRIETFDKMFSRRFENVF